MSKVLLYADIHIHPHGGKLSKMEECLRTLQWIYDQARENSISNVICLGDLFHNREQINTLAYQSTFEIIESAKLEGIETYLLLGNHDIYLRESFKVNALRPFTYISTIITEPTTLEIDGVSCDFLPYVERPQKCIEHHFSSSKSRVLFGHFSVAGGVTNKLWAHKYRLLDDSDERDVEEEQVQIASFDRYDRVLLGHFHSRQTLSESDKIHYVGSPVQVDYRDAMSEKGIEIFDLKSLDGEFIENHFSPKYFVLPSEEDLKSYVSEGSHVRLVVPANLGSTEILEMKERVLSEYSLSSVEIVPSAQEKKVGDVGLESSIIFTEDREQVLKDYLNNTEIPEGLDKERLFKIGVSLAAKE